MNIVTLFFQELQTLQKENESFCKEREDLSARLLEQEKAQEGKITLYALPHR